MILRFECNFLLVNLLTSLLTSFTGRIFLSKNRFSGLLYPWPTGAMHLVESLDLSYNDIYGTIPTTIGNSTNLGEKSLYLSL